MEIPVCLVGSDWTCTTEFLVISSQTGDALVADNSDPETVEGLPLLLNKGSLSSLEANDSLSCPSSFQKRRKKDAPRLATEVFVFNKLL